VQEKREMLLIVFLIGFAIGSPIQGYMSDKSSRKRLLIATILCVILSLCIMVFGQPVCPKEYFPILLAISCIVNGVFGNVFPVAAAAYAESINNDRASVQLSLLCRYGALFLPFLLMLPHIYAFLINAAANLLALLIIVLKFNEKVEVEE
jgi:MFS family permease